MYFACLTKCSDDDSWDFKSQDKDQKAVLQKWLKEEASRALDERVPVMWLYWPYGLGPNNDEVEIIKDLVDDIQKDLEGLGSWRTRYGGLRAGKASHHDDWRRYSTIVWGKK